MLPERRWRLRLVVLLGSTCFALLAAELGLRWLRPAELTVVSGTLQEQLQQSAQSRPIAGEGISLRGLIRPSANPRLIYELKPGLEADFQGVPVRINADGWRGPLRPQAKPAGTLRVVGLGDSVLFGWGVPEEQSFLRRLEARLNEGQGRPVEVLNLGVPGYNTAQEAELLESVGLRYAPDAVVLCFVPNDDRLPNFIQRTDGSLFDSSILFKLLKRAKQAPPEEGVPPEYAWMVGASAVRGGLERMAALGRKHGFPVFVFCFRGHRGLAAEVQQWSAELQGLHFLDFEAAMKAGGLSYGPDLELSPRDVHPNPRFHAFIADFLFQPLAALR